MKGIENKSMAKKKAEESNIRKKAKKRTGNVIMHNEKK